jgi:hypothetical protein
MVGLIFTSPILLKNIVTAPGCDGGVSIASIFDFLQEHKNIWFSYNIFSLTIVD